MSKTGLKKDPSLFLLRRTYSQRQQNEPQLSEDSCGGQIIRWIKIAVKIVL